MSSLRLETERLRARSWLRPKRSSSPISCEQAAAYLAEMAEGAAALPEVVGHVECCLSCQAELARYHKLLRHLHQLRTCEVALPEGVVAEVLSALEKAAARSAVRSVLTGRRVAYGGAVVAAGGAAAALVMLTRAKRAAGEAAC